MKEAIVIIYNHPELYPPTLNAVSSLALAYDKVKVVHRPNQVENWDYPANVRLASWNYTEPSLDQFSTFKKIRQFIHFTLKVYKEVKGRQSSDLVLIYDHMALFAYTLVRKLVKQKCKVWYHNHDVPEKAEVRKYSIGWFAKDVHEKVFEDIDLFSIPSAERLIHFPTDLLKEKTVIIPNYPSKRYFDGLTTKAIKKDAKHIRIIYQGQIDQGHGLENILEILGEQVGGKRIHLTVAGKGNQRFIEEFKTKIREAGKEDCFSFLGFIPYKELFKHTMMSDFGLGMTPDNINYSTAGQASNKIYEYAACGLPVIYSDTEHYNQYLDKYAWALKTDGTKQNLMLLFENSLDQYDDYSKQAMRDFDEELNFERHFNKVLDRFIT